MADSNDHARGVGEQRICGLGGAVELTVDLAMLEDVGAGDVEDGLLRVSAVDSEQA